MRSRVWIVLLAGAVVAGTVLVISLFMTPTYEGEATVLLTQQNTGAMLLGSPQQYLSDLALQREVQTQVNVMQSRGLLEKVIVALKLDATPNELRDKVNVRFDGQTDVVTITVTDDSAERAAQIANALAATYVVWSQDRQRSSIQAAATDVESRLATAQVQIVEAQKRIAAGDSSGARQVELKAANDLYGTLAEQLAQLKINEQLATGSGSVLSTASPNPVPVSPKPVRNSALGLVMGLILGLGIAFVAETLDNTIKTSSDAEAIYGAPVLCNIPAEKREKAKAQRLTLVTNPGGPAAEAYRMLRNNLGFINFEHDIKSVLVTSSMPNEGKSTVAANLALVLSRAGKKVVLLSCDFHQPGAAQLFGVDRNIGLSDVLAGSSSIHTILEQPTDSENLWVAPCWEHAAQPERAARLGDHGEADRESSRGVRLGHPGLRTSAGGRGCRGRGTLGRRRPRRLARGRLHAGRRLRTAWVSCRTSARARSASSSGVVPSSSPGVGTTGTTLATAPLPPSDLR